MVNRYFVQYLLNVGVLSSEEVQALLPRIAQVKPQLPLLALMKGFVTSSQLNELSGLDENTFAEEAKDKKILTALQIENLQSIVPERDVCFSQLLLDDGKLDYKGVEDHLAASAKAEAGMNTVLEAVMRRTTGKDEEPEYMTYGKYADMFIMSTQRFIATEAVILPEIPQVEPKGVLVSQRLSGGMVMTAGVMADDEVFLELGRRYSGEELTEIDELAIDCVAEFLNVLNGLYIVNLSHMDMDVDILEPRRAVNVLPEASRLAAFTVATEFGNFVLYMAEDEFMF